MTLVDFDTLTWIQLQYLHSLDIRGYAVLYSGGNTEQIPAVNVSCEWSYAGAEKGPVYLIFPS